MPGTFYFAEAKRFKHEQMLHFGFAHLNSKRTVLVHFIFKIYL